ncbi:MAG: GatB/YqeY domain-containing protein [Candidatus Magasanikbacteria bacterium]|nr:GatB/YqeY domain-containing protein [Candidatus Magasanikbacteria bacterium]
MTVLELLLASQLEARKSQDKERLSVMQLALSAVKNEQINKQKDLEDAEVVAVLQRQVKQLKDALKDFETAGRQDLIDNTHRELDILASFLPAQISEEEIRKIVDEIVVELKPASPRDFGKVMGAVMARVQGKTEGAVVQKIVREKLS